MNKLLLRITTEQMIKASLEGNEIKVFINGEEYFFRTRIDECYEMKNYRPLKYSKKGFRQKEKIYYGVLAFILYNIGYLKYHYKNRGYKNE